MDRFYVHNFGCRATQADGAAIERQFEEKGLERSPDIGCAQVVVLNTCTVTAAADHDARAAVRRVHRQNPEARIVVTGCYAQRAPQELASLAGVTQVVGNSHKHQLVELVWPQLSAAQPGEVCRLTSPDFVPLRSLASRTEETVFVSDIFAHTELMAAPVFDAANDRTRPNLKVQDGCDNRCSFCVIPFVRGQSRSLPLARILREIERLVEAGFRELVISGINLGRWGRDLDAAAVTAGSARFENLIRAILEDTRLEKLRISSVEPMDWSDELISLVAGSSRIAKHAHVPLQSGSDAVLRRMHRKYRPWHYREKVEQIRAAMPNAAIGADVMVGFPGETEAEFEETRRMIAELPLTYLHVFTYSARPGTPAAHMAGQVPGPVARERNRILRELAVEKKQAFLARQVGVTLPSITLHGSSQAGNPSPWSAGEEVTQALTDNYLKLVIDRRIEANRWIAAHIDRVEDGALRGRVAGNSPQHANRQ